jgi:DNA-binding transcriptional LysR family regulator
MMTPRPPLNLAAVDLNLLVVFDALMAERHLSRAAARVGLSQPAMSHALRRLRGLIGDDLFVRGPGGMDPTPRALALADPVGVALDGLRRALAGEPAFDPATAHDRFRLAMSDAMAAHILSPVLRRIRVEAPGVDLQLIAAGDREGVEHVLSGEADLGVGVHPHLPDGLASQVISTAVLVCIADADNPALANGLDLQTFIDLPHLGITVGQQSGASIDSLLDQMGVTRRIMVSVPHFLVAPAAVAGTDLIAVVPEGLMGAGTGRIRVHPIPIPAPEIHLRMVWRIRRQSEPGLTWLRTLLAEAMAAPDLSP